MSKPVTMNMNSTFSVPKFKEEEEQKDDSLVWSTEKVEQYIEAINSGYNVKSSPFFEKNNIEYKKGNIVFEYTDFELEEIKKCAKDIIYFANNYCQVMTDDGYSQIVLRDYQIKVLKQFQDPTNRFNIFLSARQIGKTITSCIFLAWYSIFHFEKNILVMSNVGSNSKELMDKIKIILQGLPFFMKPGVLKKDVMTLVFDNQCRIFAKNTTKTGGISFTIHLLFLDEFAHVHNSIKRPFYENVYPTLSSSKISRVVITSTPNGLDLFHDLYVDAVAKLNEYKPIKVDWWEVPGRDEEWRRRELANLGSEDAFNQQYGCQFINASTLLLDGADLKRLDKSSVEFIHREIDVLDDLGLDYSFLKWKPDFELEDINNNNYFVMTIDLAEGIGKDYTVFNIFRLKKIENKFYDKILAPGSIVDFFGLEQVGLFHCNTMSIDNITKILYVLSSKLFSDENLRLIIEFNTYGGLLIKTLMTVFPNTNDFAEDCIVKFKHSETSNIKRNGVRLNAKNKKIFCERVKKAIKEGKIEIFEKNTVEEASKFNRNSNDTYSALAGHDDIFMTVVLLIAFFESYDFTEYVQEYFDLLTKEEQDEIENIFDNGDGTIEDFYDIF